MIAKAIDSGSAASGEGRDQQDVAVLDCSRPVTAMPQEGGEAVARAGAMRGAARRRSARQARAHHAHAHSSSATLPSTFRMVSTPCMIAESYASFLIDESFLTNL